MDVRAERVIPQPPERVAACAMDGYGVGTEVTRTAKFLGRRINYVLRVRSYEPPSLLDLRSVAGPFPMHVTYRFNAHPDGTLASIQVRGEAGGYYRVAGPIMDVVVRASLRKDLRELARKLS